MKVRALIKKVFFLIGMLGYNFAIYAQTAPGQKRVILKPIVGPAKQQQDFGSIASSLTGTGISVSKLFKTASITAGVGLILFSLVQYGKHRKNPVEVTLGSVVTTFFIGLALIGLAFIPMGL